MRWKISICITTYNHEQYIENCIASVLGQHVDADLEILVGDDCSSDETRAIVSYYAEMYPEKLFPVFHEKNLGGSKNYHSLIRRATGDFIAHLDGDDFWLPGKLAAQLAFLLRLDGCSAVWSNAIVISRRGELVGPFNGLVAEEFDINYLLMRGNFLLHSSLMYRSTCKEDILGIGEEFIDYHLYMFLTKQGTLGYINSLLAVYRTGSRRILHTVNLRYWRAIMCAQDMGASKEAINHSISNFYVDILSGAVKQNNFKELRFWTSDIYNKYKKVAVTLIFSILVILSIRVFRIIWRKLIRTGISLHTSNR
jgi:glycosyltransferase involved in cell wall biosynthesis